MNVTYFVPRFPSAQTFITNCFCEAPFQDQPNLITSERKIDKVKVCGESDIFSHLCTDNMMYINDKSHFLFEGVTQDLRLYVYVLPGVQRHSQLEAKLSTIVQGNPCLMVLSSLWVFLAFIFSGRDAPTHGWACSG